MGRKIRGVVRTSESPALSLMASNCSLEMHSWTFPSPWMPLAAALHLMARLSGRAGPASSAPRAKKIESLDATTRPGSPARGAGEFSRRGATRTRARAAADPPKRAMRRDRTRDPGGRRFRRDAPSGGARDARGREAGGVERESRRGHICVDSVCGGGGEAFGAEGLGWGPRDFGESSGGWSACGEATRARVSVWRASPRPMHSRENCQIGRNAGRAGPLKTKKIFLRLDFCDWRA